MIYKISFKNNIYLYINDINNLHIEIKINIILSIIIAALAFEIFRI
jgi:hypothetical protein